MIKGLGASSGIAMGPAYVIPAWDWEFPDKMVDATELSFEFERLYDGVRSSKDELEHIKQEIREVLGQEQSYIFDAHLAILEDPVFMNEIQGIISRQYKAAEVAVKEVIDKFVDMFDVLDDDYMKERAMDIKDVGNRLLKHLLGTVEDTPPPADHAYVLVAKELTPSQLVHLDPASILGIVTMMGGLTSHTSIMSRAMGIPFVLGLEGKLIRPIQNGDMVIVDGEEGVVYVNPDHETIELYESRKNNWLLHQERLQEIAHVPSMTEDRKSVRLAANIGSIKEIDQALKNGAIGVGLFRSEFLYMDRDSLPDENEQYDVYRQAAVKLEGKPLIIRTLDIGGDKKLDYLPMQVEDNPALGCRAIRISLERHELFKTQLRAILRASHFGQVKIMYPMISSLNELRQANELLAQAKQDLSRRGQPFNPNIEVGLTIEVPGAALIADVLAKEVNFFSIGTNDLIQFVLAVDRMNDSIAHLYDPYHPAVIRLLKLTIDAAKSAGIPVAVCGEFAGDIRALPLWLGLGIEELSMSMQLLLPIKHRLLTSNHAECERMLEEVLKCGTSEEIIGVLESSNSKSSAS
ncbi:phosphoenolpyruvate--protein phosphotransferase [Paenibacillus lutrae]|uniref:Phosphoenolpyruvate-protein phosphotransferase n=1 Tax=Paenibacillus lutrae TaxID=2078573 RepID=A0A7X3JYL9_9BACL|nr:phosphoenolpyruvate--protein phosphotransferase [Paenibacillus lutrae]MVO99273.1 phosphoenolpyruvate--protein phosphotransferase [Paenibacillus lutrae]